MTIQELIGEYTIIGTNQDESNNTYKGTLSLTLDIDNRIVASWKIHTDQEHTGIGFKGIVVYKCITNDILDGFWSEEFGDSNYLGSEQCFRIKEQEKFIN